MTTKWDQEIREVAEALNDVDRPNLASDALVCECFCVSLGDILEFVRETGETDVGALQRRFHLGTGCGSCLKRRDEWEPALKAGL